MAFSISSTLRDRRYQFILSSLITFILFWGTARLGISFGALPPSNLTVIWLPAGIGLTACMAFGYRILPAIWFAAFLINFQDFAAVSPWNLGSELLHSFLAAPINTAQAAIAYTLWQRLLGQPIRNSQQLLKFIGWVCLLPTALTLPLLFVNQALGGFLPWNALSSSLVTIWMGDSLGIFLVLPLYDAWRNPDQGSSRNWQTFGLGLLALTGILILTFWVYPVLLGIALFALLGLAMQSGLRGSATGVMILSVIALSATRQSLGPFQRLSPENPYLAVILLMFSFGIAVHIVALQYSKIRRQRDRLNQVVSGQENELIQKVKERDKAQVKLEEAKHFAEDLIQSASTIIVILDVQGRIQKLNPFAEEVLGYCNAEMVGRDWFEFIAPCDRCPSIWEQFQSLAAKDLPKDFENLVLTKSGQERYIIWRNSQIIQDQKCVGFVSFGMDVTEKRQAEAKLIELARHDFLTGLPNRFLLKEQGQELLALAKRNQEMLAVIFIDLDRFKTINDNLGHEIGDRVLIQFTEYLRRSVRQSDVIARLSGDEFVVLLPNTDNLGAAKVAEKIQQQTAETLVIDTYQILLTTSLGISLYPVDGEDLDTLIQQADAAMYSIKEEGRNSFGFFTAAIEQRTQARLTLEEELRLAIARQQLCLLYQPQISLEDGSTVGLEALIRWRHPRLGLLTPQDFLPIAIQIDLMQSLQRWVLKTACQQNIEWQQQGFKLLPVSVNFAGFPIYDFESQIHQILAESELSPQYLGLELNETILDCANPELNRQFTRFSDLGLTLAIDNFGSPSSTLVCLKKQGFYRLKIDASLIHNLDFDPVSQKIVAAIIRLGCELGMRVLAEGVETESQRQWLQEHHCHEIQGYLVSLPLPADKITRFLMQI